MTQSTGMGGFTRRALLRRVGLGAAVGLAAPSLLRATAAYAAYPEQPIKIVVPNTPGGPSDVVARLLAPALQDAIGGTVIVENVGGGGGNIGMGRVARATPDGYTLLLSTSGFVINASLFDPPAYDALNGFAPIAELATSPNVYAVKPELGATTMKQFVELVRKAPEKFNVGTPPVGNTPHLATEVLKQRERLPGLAIVFHTGGGQAIQAVLSDAVQCYCGSLSTAHAHITAGTLIGLAVTGPTRWHDLPSVPTMLEAGYPDFVFDNYTALSAPAHTPPEIVERLEKQILSILPRPQMQEQLRKSGFEVIAQGGKVHMARIHKEIPMYRKIIQDAGIKVSKGG